MVEPASERLLDYLCAGLWRAQETYGRRPLGDPAHPLALGEAVGLFNLADELGLIEPLRRRLAERGGGDLYRGLSEAMKRYYLGAGSAQPGRSAGGQSDRRGSGRPGRAGATQASRRERPSDRGGGRPPGRSATPDEPAEHRGSGPPAGPARPR